MILQPPNNNFEHFQTSYDIKQGSYYSRKVQGEVQVQAKVQATGISTINFLKYFLGEILW